MLVCHMQMDVEMRNNPVIIDAKVCFSGNYLYLLINFLFQHSFFKQFYGAVTKADYTTLRLGFVTVGYKFEIDSLLKITSLASPTLTEH